MSILRPETDQTLPQPKDSPLARSEVALRDADHPATELVEQARGKLGQYFTARRRRIWREYLTAYALITPAMLLIFVFGLFPVVFALYVSLHKWLIVQGEFRGLTNYVGIIDNFAYVALFGLGVGALVGAGILVRRVYLRSKEDDASPWPLAIPAGLYAAASFAFVRWFFLQLPEFLDIYDTDPHLQLRTLVRGDIYDESQYGDDLMPDWDRTVLADALPSHNGLGDTFYTWRNDSGPFDPGPLDRIIYSDSVMRAANSFVLNTEILSDEALSALGLERYDVLLDVAAGYYDHLPIVVDFVMGDQP